MQFKLHIQWVVCQLKAYQMEIENPAFDEDAEDSKVTEIALGLAF